MCARDCTISLVYHWVAGQKTATSIDIAKDNENENNLPDGGGSDSGRAGGCWCGQEKNATEKRPTRLQ